MPLWAAGQAQMTPDDDVCVAVEPSNTTVLGVDGVTNPLLLNTLVAAVDEAMVFPDSKTIVCVGRVCFEAPTRVERGAMV